VPGEGSKEPIIDRLKRAILKPAPEAPLGKDEEAQPAPAPTVEELQDQLKAADDKERAVGLIAAPLAGGIGILVISALISKDPAAPSRLHVNVSTYHELTGVLVVLALLMIVMALLRKRLYLGIVLALYGLAIFNLHYWGFGVPFLLAGAWLLVRAYRLQRDVKEATGGGSRTGSTADGASRPTPSKRYTPPTAPPKRPAVSKPDNGRKAS
jgi:hypothetical protein